MVSGVFNLPQYGLRTVAAIEIGEVEDFKHQLLTRVSTTTGRPLTPGSVKIILADFRRIINKGLTWGMVKKKQNAVSKIRVADADRQRERFLTPAEAEKLLDCLQYISCNLYYVVTISLYTGMRLSEVLNIKWQDIDHTAGVIHLNGKTGRRPAYIPEEIKTILVRLRPQKPSDHLFCTSTGSPMRSKKVSTKFSEIVDALGFNTGVTESTRRVVFHTLRHTFCSWLAMKGVPLYTIGKLVGHASHEMTQRYAKLSPDTQREALKYIRESLKENH